MDVAEATAVAQQKAAAFAASAQGASNSLLGAFRNGASFSASSNGITPPTPAKAPISFVIPKNKFGLTKPGHNSGALVAVSGNYSKWESVEPPKKALQPPKPPRTTKWGPDPLQEAKVKRGRALALQGRKREQLEIERKEAIGECVQLNPAFKPPAGWRPLLKDAKLFVPQREYPGYNFIGLILGPRGNTQKRMEQETGAKIAIRGKGAVKEGKQGFRKDGKVPDGANEELHVYISADTIQKVDAALALIEPLLTPVDEIRNQHKRKQLRELALMNGTIREFGQACKECGETGHNHWQCPNEKLQTFNAQVSCGICGDGGHPSVDCPQRFTAGEYQSFLEELNVEGLGAAAGSPKAPDSAAPSTKPISAIPRPGPIAYARGRPGAKLGIGSFNGAEGATGPLGVGGERPKPLPSWAASMGMSVDGTTANLAGPGLGLESRLSMIRNFGAVSEAAGAAAAAQEQQQQQEGAYDAGFQIAGALHSQAAAHPLDPPHHLQQQQQQGGPQQQHGAPPQHAYPLAYQAATSQAPSGPSSLAGYEAPSFPNPERAGPGGGPQPPPGGSVAPYQVPAGGAAYQGVPLPAGMPPSYSHPLPPAPGGGHPAASPGGGPLPPPPPPSYPVESFQGQGAPWGGGAGAPLPPSLGQGFAGPSSYGPGGMQQQQQQQQAMLQARQTFPQGPGQSQGRPGNISGQQQQHHQGMQGMQGPDDLAQPSFGGVHGAYSGGGIQQQQQPWQLPGDSHAQAPPRSQPPTSAPPPWQPQGQPVTPAVQAQPPPGLPPSALHGSQQHQQQQQQSQQGGMAPFIGGHAPPPWAAVGGAQQARPLGAGAGAPSRPGPGQQPMHAQQQQQVYQGPGQMAGGHFNRTSSMPELGPLRGSSGNATARGSSSSQRHANMQRLVVPGRAGDARSTFFSSSTGAPAAQFRAAPVLAFQAAVQ
eukprot:jgi/Mesen1/525/ME000104S10621